MRHLLFVLFIIIAGCGKEEDKPVPTNCDCDVLIGKRWYPSIPANFYGECSQYDAIYFGDDGYIDLYRNGGSNKDKKMDNVMKYKFYDNDCTIIISDLNSSKVLPDPNCPGVSNPLKSIINDLRGVSDGKTYLNVDLVDCETFGLGPYNWHPYR